MGNSLNSLIPKLNFVSKYERKNNEHEIKTENPGKNCDEKKWKN